MRFHAELKAEHLRALSHLAAQQDVRYYLNGVQVLARPEILLGATDGTVVGVLDAGATANTAFTILVPNDVLKQIAKAKGLVVLRSDDGDHWTLQTGALSLSWKDDRGRFPDLSRVIPRSTSGEAWEYDSRLLAKFWKVAKDLDADRAGAHSVLLRQNGGSTGLVSMPCAPQFIGALGHLNRGERFPVPATAAPDWLPSSFHIADGWRDLAPGADLV